MPQGSSRRQWLTAMTSALFGWCAKGALPAPAAPPAPVPTPPPNPSIAYDPLGTVTTYPFDATRPGAVPIAVATSVYDALGRLVSRVEGGGDRTGFPYPTPPAPPSTGAG